MEVLYKQEELPAIATRLLEKVTGRVLAFYGPMGAGKTTLIKALLSNLGGVDRGSSPTFGIVNEYHDKNGKVLAYHFDFYRLEEETEALDLGFDEYLGQDAWIFIEWPERIAGLLPDDFHRISLEVVDPRTRKLKLL